MSRIVKDAELKQFEETKQTKGKKYPWEEWQDGQVREIDPIKEFEVNKLTLKSSIIHWIRRNAGFEAKVIDGENGKFKFKISKKAK